MRPQVRGRIADIILAGAVVAGVAAVWAGRGPAAVQSEFAQAVDLSRLGGVAVQHNGRLKSFDSLARSTMKFVSGPHKINGQTPSFSYLDLMFRSQAYQDADFIYVKHKNVRKRIAQKLAQEPTLAGGRLARFQENGLIAPALLVRPAISLLLQELEQDLIRTNKAARAVRTALAVSEADSLAANLRILPPPGLDHDRIWLPIGQLVPGAGGAPNTHRSISGLDVGAQREVAHAWHDLAAGWGRQDAKAVNAAVVQLAEHLGKLNPAIYPPTDKLNLESWYLKVKALVWAWVVYLLAVAALLMGVVYRFRSARLGGLLLFVLAFALHATSIGIRWYLSGRIPNSNMYEATMAATWFGGAAALIIEFLVRKTAFRSLFVVGAGVCAAVAMMCSHFMPVTLSSDIDHIMPVLNDLWLYVHTNVIIFSYCLIGMAAVTALLYLRYRLGSGDRSFARAGGAGGLILAKSPVGSFVKSPSATMGQVLDGATMILMELAFVLLWTGIAMGAIWADHSWGRPWGWDPKEVFALNTFIVFLILVHVRMKVRDKALWTAVLACVGCAVMLFNWIVVNFIIVGLHSYA